MSIRYQLFRKKGVNPLDRPVSEIYVNVPQWPSQGRQGEPCLFQLSKTSHGCDHNVSNCSLRHQCSESLNRSQCKYCHHPLLHLANATNSATALTVLSVTSSKQTALPVILVDITLTERSVLSQIARIFDPVGFAAAFLVRTKIGMQRLAQQGLEWDQELPSAAWEEWIRFFQEMGDLNHVTFERSFIPVDTIALPILCIFSDASNENFGACAYVRWQTEGNEYDTWFIAAKSRVAPLKPLTIPRLELQAAILATRLYQSIAEESRMQFEKVVFFSDSNIILSWIRSQAREIKPFVSARVAEVQSNSDPSQWRHVPGELNVTDDVSCGIPAQRLIGRWKQWPEFLRLPEEEWPQENSTADLNEVEKECRKTQAILLTGSPEVIDCKKFSNWRKLVRTSAYVFRFIRNLRTRCQAKKLPENPEQQI